MVRFELDACNVMEGFIDELRQGFLTVDIGVGPLDFMIDTGFSGTLVVAGQRQVECGGRA